MTRLPESVPGAIEYAMGVVARLRDRDFREREYMAEDYSGPIYDKPRAAELFGAERAQRAKDRLDDAYDALAGAWSALRS